MLTFVIIETSFIIEALWDIDSDQHEKIMLHRTGQLIYLECLVLGGTINFSVWPKFEIQFCFVD